MKRVAIITINDYHNYGNRLQNFAIQEVIKSLGFDVETITIDSVQQITLKQRILRFIKLSYTQKIVIFKNKILDKVNRSYNLERLKSFKEFTNRNIIETEYSISLCDIPKDLEKKFAFFVVGSDQVWNPIFGRGNAIDFLTFAPPNKRIAYAASFGISNIPNEFEEKFKSGLTEMAKISVREKAGNEIVKKLIGREVPVLVDPTLMITKEKWLNLSKKSPNHPEGKYLLTYFLGNTTNEMKTTVKNVAKRNNLEIVRLTNIKDKKRYVADPSEFIDYINSASILFTDSFHGAIFSILLKRPFVIFDRNENMPAMSSRIETLLSTFNLSTRKWRNNMSNEEIFIVDYSQIETILELERKKSIEYLKEAFCIENGIEYEN